MKACEFLIGTKKQQMYIRAYLQGSLQNYDQFVSQGQLLNGVPYLVTSGIIGVNSISIAFPRTDEMTLENIRKLVNGNLGTGYIHMENVYGRNILPASWSTPHNQNRGGIRFDRFQSEVYTDTPDNKIGLPVEGIDIIMPDNGFRYEWTFLVPDECDIVCGFKGTSSSVRLEMTWGDDTIPIDFSDDFNRLYDTTISRSDHPTAGRVATLRAVGNGDLSYYGGTLSYNGRHGTINSAIAVHGNTFVDGTGMSGAVLQETTLGVERYGAMPTDKKLQLKHSTFTLSAQEWAKS